MIQSKTARAESAAREGLLFSGRMPITKFKLRDETVSSSCVDPKS